MTAPDGPRADARALIEKVKARRAYLGGIGFEDGLLDALEAALEREGRLRAQLEDIAEGTAATWVSDAARKALEG